MKSEENHRLDIKISDTGCGMTPSEVEQIFNPEYTTKEKGVGLGLALSLASKVQERPLRSRYLRQRMING